MKKVRIIVLACALLGLTSIPLSAQVSNTGPAGLARQMPRIYGPYMANRARIKYQQKHGRQRRHVNRHVSSRTRRH